jgi:CelD/BcsL family acetyltransferase involved in cellulose biosynthesis
MGVIVRERTEAMNSKNSASPPIVRRLTLVDTLAAELPEWESSIPGASAATPMQSRPWVLACAESFVGDGRLNVILIEDAGGVAAVAPLIRRASFPAVNELLGARELSEPSDFLFRDENALAALMRVLSREAAPLLVHRMLTGSSSIAALRAAFHGKGLVVSRPGNNCPHIALEAGAGSADHLLSSRLRSDLRRAQRKAESHGTVSYEIHTPRTAQEFLPLYEQALEVEAAGWKGRGGSALARNARQRGFFRRYGVLASEAGILRLAFMRINGTLAAMQYAVQWNGAFWLLKIGYDEDYARLSPGMLLIQHTLQYACREGLRSYEFLGSAETWTQRWTTAERTTARIAVYPFGPAGMCTLGRDLFRAIRRKAGARIEAHRRARQAPTAAGTRSAADASATE